MSENKSLYWDGYKDAVDDMEKALNSGLLLSPVGVYLWIKQVRIKFDLGVNNERS